MCDVTHPVHHGDAGCCEEVRGEGRVGFGVGVQLVWGEVDRISNAISINQSLTNWTRLFKARFG